MCISARIHRPDGALATGHVPWRHRARWRGGGWSYRISDETSAVIRHQRRRAHEGVTLRLNALHDLLKRRQRVIVGVDEEARHALRHDAVQLSLADDVRSGTRQVIVLLRRLVV